MMNCKTGFMARQACFVLVGALCAAPTLAAAESNDALLVQRIETRGSGAEREVVIHTSAKPTFSVFRLSEPFRVLVDVNNAKTSAPMDLQKVDDGVVRYVSTNQFVDEQSSILRVEIALDGPLPYEVNANGNAIVVKIGAGQPATEAKPAPAITEAAPANVQLGRLTRRSRGARTVLSAPVLKGALSDVKVEMMQLDEPTRVVVDLVGATAQPKWQRVKVRKMGVKMARVADRDGAVRVVFDIADGAELPEVTVDAVAGRLELSVRAAKKPAPAPIAKAQPAAKPEPAPVAEAQPAPVAEPAPVVAKAEPAPAPVVAKTEPAVAEVKSEAAVAMVPDAVVTTSPTPAATAPVRNVKDVRFEQKDGFVRLTVLLDDAAPKANRESREGSEVPTIRIPATALPSHLERTLDVAEVAGGVLSAVSTYADGGDLIVAANIVPGTEHRHWTKKNRMMWDFRNRLAKATTKVAKYSDEVTSGYSSDAVQTASRVAPTKARYKGRRISLDLKDADVKNVLRLLADVSKLNIVAADDVEGNITVKLRNVPWDQALDIILRSKQLDKTRNGNIIRVAPITVLAAEEALRLERRKSRVQLEPLTVRLIPVSYAVAADVKPQINALLTERGKVNVDTRTNVLVVEDISEVLLKAERLVRTLDTQTPQVLIESRIVEARSNFGRELGIQWGGNVSATQGFGTSTGLTFPNNISIAGGADDIANNVTTGVVNTPNYAVNLPAAGVGSGGGGALGFTFGSIGGAALISLRLSAAETMGKVKIISAPKIVTLDNKEAKIVSGEKVPITVVTANGPTTRFINANLELVVTPHVTQDGSILLRVAAKKNELSDRRDLLGVPGIITKEAETEMIVRDGDTAVMGGIYRRNATENKNYVPWLGKIPVLGWLFKRSVTTDARDELLIFISPRIVNRSAALVQSS